MLKVKNIILMFLVLSVIQSCKSDAEKFTIIDANYAEMSGYKNILLGYKKIHGVFPDEKNVRSGRIFNRQFKDVWGNDYLYFTDGYNFCLLSKGYNNTDKSDDSYIIYINNNFYEHYYKLKSDL